MKISPEELENRVRDSHRIALDGDMSGSQKVLTDLILDGVASIQEIRPLMGKIDPERVVWNGAIAPEATGLHGLPLVEAKYIFASNVYGHEITRVHGNAIAHAEFIDACEEGYDNGPLHDCGYVVVDRETGLYLFMITEVIDGELIEPADVAKIGDNYGVEATLMAFSHEPLESGGKPGQVCLTAVIENANQFKLVHSIANEFADLVRAASPSPQM